MITHIQYRTHAANGVERWMPYYGLTEIVAIVLNPVMYFVINESATLA